ncbi:response regulator transcription factor [Xylanimonas allomyrinae]|uniref:Response regulator transcription factor n=1 Tax=Xylanimonas allomyrinae TaxID=2509459 RepID=A0A4V0YE77_9MICO|nr:response regulator transcription factor [Xylanimonas allomyrinae]QAY63251.1 response regulator transcription factor [Xylanimonas allomyrinae]
MTLRLLVADDEPLVRAGIVAILETDDDLRVVAQCASGAEVVPAIQAYRPDVVLLDVRMGGGSSEDGPSADGLSALAEVRRLFGALPCLMVTTFGEDEYVAGAMRHAADGFVLKSGDPRELLLAVHAVATGGAWFSPSISRKILDAGLGRGLARREEAVRLVARLTHREQQVIALIGDGRSNTEIANLLFLAEGTVKVHVTAILRKTGARNRVEAALLAARAGDPLAQS